MTAQDFGRYTLLRPLATGGMAEVFLARQKGLEGFEKLLVIKRILPHLANDEEFVNMFLNEARIAARFNHPNIVQIFDLGKEEDSYFIAMEFIHGEDLGRVMRSTWSAKTSMPVPLALRVMAATCEGLYYAHSRRDERGQPLGVVHRDISPQNILVSFDGGVKIVDFGIARASDQGSTTRAGAIKGKYAYMSPEQASGKAIDHRSDLFAAGLVLYELLTGSRPFKRDSEILTLKAAADCEIQAPSMIARLPPALDALVMKALARDPADRYPDARAFQLAIEGLLVEQRWAVTSVDLSEFMHQLFADRLRKESQLGEPVVRGSESSSWVPIVTRSPAAPSRAEQGDWNVPEPTPAAEPLPRRRTRAPNPTGPEAQRPRRTREGSDSAEPKPARRSSTAVPRRSTPAPAASSGRRRSVLFANPEADALEQLAARNAVAAPPAVPPEEEAVPEPSAPPRPVPARRRARERPPRRWPAVLLGLMLGVGALAFVPGLPERAELMVERVRELVAERSAAPGANSESGRAWLWLESDVPVEVFLGAERLGGTPLNGKPVPAGRLALKLVSTNLGIERIVMLKAEPQGELRHHERFSVGRVRFHADRECDVYIGDRKVARAPGPPLDYFEGSYAAECRNEHEGLVGRKKFSISPDTNRIAEVSFKLERM